MIARQLATIVRRFDPVLDMSAHAESCPLSCAKRQVDKIGGVDDVVTLEPATGPANRSWYGV